MNIIDNFLYLNLYFLCSSNFVAFKLDDLNPFNPKKNGLAIESYLLKRKISLGNILEDKKFTQIAECIGADEYNYFKQNASKELINLVFSLDRSKIFHFLDFKINAVNNNLHKYIIYINNLNIFLEKKCNEEINFIKFMVDTINKTDFNFDKFKKFILNGSKNNFNI